MTWTTSGQLPHRLQPHLLRPRAFQYTRLLLHMLLRHLHMKLVSIVSQRSLQRRYQVNLARVSLRRGLHHRHHLHLNLARVSLRQ